MRIRYVVAALLAALALGAMGRSWWLMATEATRTRAEIAWGMAGGLLLIGAYLLAERRRAG
jgi:hypothetical protein